MARAVLYGAESAYQLSYHSALLHDTSRTLSLLLVDQALVDIAYLAFRNINPIDLTVILGSLAHLIFQTTMTAVLYWSTYDRQVVKQQLPR